MMKPVDVKDNTYIGSIELHSNKDPKINVGDHVRISKGKSVVAERFIRTLKTKIHKHMTSVSKNVYMDKLDDIVNEYNNTYHRKIKMKPIDVKDNTYIDSAELRSMELHSGER